MNRHGAYVRARWFILGYLACLLTLGLLEYLAAFFA